jgi:hypothetical protein
MLVITSEARDLLLTLLIRHKRLPDVANANTM